MSKDLGREWEVQVLGTRETFRGLELSVIRKGHMVGRGSYGWGDLDKIIMFSSGLGANLPGHYKPELYDEMLAITRLLCDALNEQAEKK